MPTPHKIAHNVIAAVKLVQEVPIPVLLVLLNIIKRIAQLHHPIVVYKYVL